MQGAGGGLGAGRVSWALPGLASCSGTTRVQGGHSGLSGGGVAFGPQQDLLEPVDLGHGAEPALAHPRPRVRVVWFVAQVLTPD